MRTARHCARCVVTLSRQVARARTAHAAARAEAQRLRAAEKKIKALEAEIGEMCHLVAEGTRAGDEIRSLMRQRDEDALKLVEARNDVGVASVRNHVTHGLDRPRTGSTAARRVRSASDPIQNADKRARGAQGTSARCFAIAATALEINWLVDAAITD